MIKFKFFRGYQKEREPAPVVNMTARRRAFWTPDLVTDLARYHTLDIEEELVNLLSRELSQEIDNTIIEMLRNRI